MSQNLWWRSSKNQRERERERDGKWECDECNDDEVQINKVPRHWRTSKHKWGETDYQVSQLCLACYEYKKGGPEWMKIKEKEHNARLVTGKCVDKNCYCEFKKVNLPAVKTK